MAKFDLEVRGITGGNLRRRVAASATRGRVGEPLMTTPTYSSGTTNANTVVVVTDAKPVIGTDEFKGICAKDFEVDSAGTVTAHYTSVTQFIPNVTRVRGKAKTAANIDTQTELTGVLDDTTVFDLTGSTYTIDVGGVSDGGALSIVDGNTTRGTVDCVVDARAFRTDVTV